MFWCLESGFFKLSQKYLISVEPILALTIEAGAAFDNFMKIQSQRRAQSVVLANSHWNFIVISCIDCKFRVNEAY